jgi:hypothetical protein
MFLLKVRGRNEEASEKRVLAKDVQLMQDVYSPDGQLIRGPEPIPTIPAPCTIL